MTRGLLAALAGLVLTGCTARQAYEHNRSLAEQQARCDEKRTAEEVAKCRAAYAHSYEEYRRELEDLERSTTGGTP